MSHSLTPTQQRHRSYLFVTAFVVGSFGPIFTLGTMASTSGLATWALDLLNWPLDGAQNFAAPTTRFLSALTGGFLFGWGMMIVGLRLWVYDLAPEGVRKAILLGLCSWFVLDSLGSVLAEAPSNVAFNVVVLLLAVGPLWRSGATEAN